MSCIVIITIIEELLLKISQDKYQNSQILPQIKNANLESTIWCQYISTKSFNSCLVIFKSLICTNKKKGLTPFTQVSTIWL